MPFTHALTVQFRDTDAAGVVYFANILSLCHGAYEASLASSGIDLHRFFSGKEVALPIAHASVDFFRPLYCGDRLSICLTPQPLNDSEFEISYDVFLETRPDKAASKARTRHVCINPASRSRTPLSPEMARWLQTWSASAP